MVGFVDIDRDEPLFGTANNFVILDEYQNKKEINYFVAG